MDLAWCCLRRQFCFFKRHILILTELQDVKYITRDHLDRFEFILFQNRVNKGDVLDLQKYLMVSFKCPDDMRTIRFYIKKSFNINNLGHVYVMQNNCMPIYAMLKEWYVQDAFDIYEIKHNNCINEPPHVLVFDLDSTLITDQKHINIRDERIYDSLNDLRKRGCILILWSYGSERHVSESMDKAKLNSYFDIIICGGYKIDTSKRKTAISYDKYNNKIYKDNFFYSDVTDDHLPKSPRVVLWYLQNKGFNHIKSITLIDDLKKNNYSYDFFVNLKPCPVPRDDWHIYHDEIMSNLDEHDVEFRHEMNF
jgi:viral phosphatase